MKNSKIEEWVVISGKGGTGKTSITASLASLAAEQCASQPRSILADCDVDAADLHLLLSPEVKERHLFVSGHEAIIDEERCTGCGICEEYCRFNAVDRLENGKYRVNLLACEGCGVCVRFCPVQAIRFEPCECGEWYLSETRYGAMVHARLKAGAENSGRLVSQVRREAKELAEKQGADLIIVDGPPGIGCPVIATLTGATRVLIVTEPTLSGAHDLLRVLELTRHFSIPATVCVNKWDINPDQTAKIERAAEEAGATLAGRVSYDSAVVEAQVAGKSIVEVESRAAEELKQIWTTLTE